MSPMYAFISGMIALGAAVAGVLFAQSWRTTKDRLFLMFALAFFLLSFERLVHVVLFHYAGEDHVGVYTLRLVAFVLIIAAIIDKNRSEKR